MSSPVVAICSARPLRVPVAAVCSAGLLPIRVTTISSTRPLQDLQAFIFSVGPLQAACSIRHLRAKAALGHRSRNLCNMASKHHLPSSAAAGPNDRISTSRPVAAISKAEPLQAQAAANFSAWPLRVSVDAIYSARPLQGPVAAI